MILRDYIGSADAHQIARGLYDSLIKSKFRDTGYTNDKMRQGLLLETEVLIQYAAELGLEEILGQWSPEDEFMFPYCQCTIDGLARVNTEEIWEVKTSKYKAPANVEELKKRYMKYWHQVQFQMWRSGIYRAKILWCYCPEDESPFDENGDLDITVIPITWSQEISEVFCKNCPEFWEKWTAAKAEREAEDERRDGTEVWEADCA